MDLLSISASITAILQLTGTVIGYIKNAKGASEDRNRILAEVASVHYLLYQLKDQSEESQSDKYSVTLKSLSSPNGPLIQFKQALERLSSKLQPAGGGWKDRTGFDVAFAER
jgi:hypothetical protein